MGTCIYNVAGGSFLVMMASALKTVIGHH